MSAKVILCGVIGHRWRVDQAAQEIEPVLLCGRCGRRQIAAHASGFDARIAAKTNADRWVGPTSRRR